MRGVVRWWLAIALALGLSAVPATAEELTPEAQALVDQLTVALDGLDDPLLRYEAFESFRPALEAEAASDPMLPLLIAVLGSDTTGAAAAEFVFLNADALAAGESDLSFAGEDFLVGLSGLPAVLTPTAADLAALGGALGDLAAAGAPLPEPDSDPYIWQDLADDAAAAAASGGNEGPDVPELVGQLADLIPASMVPSLGGASQAAFTDVYRWNAETWAATTDGIHAIADGIRNGQLDEARMAAVVERLEDLRSGPWSSDTTQDFIREWVEDVPGLGLLARKMWPTPEPEACKAIMCDCENVELNIGDVFRQECYAVERELKQLCQATGVVQGTCHPTASGPAAMPAG